MPSITEGKHAADFVLSESARSRSRDNITIQSGSGVVEPGTVLGKAPSGAYVPSSATASDGSEVAVALNLYRVDATSADVDASAITRDAEVNGKCLVYDASIDDAAKIEAKREQLAAVGVIVR